MFLDNSKQEEVVVSIVALSLGYFDSLQEVQLLLSVTLHCQVTGMCENHDFRLSILGNVNIFTRFHKQL